MSPIKMSVKNLTNSLMLFISYVIVICYLFDTATAQRSLHHWRRDLEHRLTQYNNHRNIISNIISSSIYATQAPQINAPIVINSNGNVRFSDLIIPHGALVFDGFPAQRSVKIMRDKTQSFVGSKMNELNQIQGHLEDIHRKLQNEQYIYKTHRYNNTRQQYRILGPRVFKQVPHAHQVTSYNVTLAQINFTNVDKVISDTYMLHPKFNLVDSENRLFFEGRKTFWNAVFMRPLKSGCCDRLKPLHTSRMMLRSMNQDVHAPIMIHSRDPQMGQQSAIIRQLSTNQMFNSVLNLTNPGQMMRIDMSPPENLIRLPSLININQPDQPELLKTIVFKDTLNIDEAHLAHNYADGRLVMGITSVPGFQFDLSHDNYLLKFLATKGESSIVQHLRGSTIITGPSHFVANLDSQSVNGLENFNRFARDDLVRIDRPATIRGSVQFNALPAMLNPIAGGLSRSPQNVVALHVGGRQGLQVGLVNGMRIPQDIILLPGGRFGNQTGTLRPNDLIHVRGFRQFVNQVTFYDNINVSGLINNVQMPGGVIPLHLNDFVGSTGRSNLYFMDGISVQHMTTESGQFDELILRDVHGDAQSIIMRSVLAKGPDGSLLLRAPLRVINVNMINANSRPNHGLLNGFRPQDILELSPLMGPATRYLLGVEPLHGRKTFLAPVEADECIFNDINQVANWTNHLIRIDRPHLLQTIHTRLAFSRPSRLVDNNNNPNPTLQASSVSVDHFKVEFVKENHPIDYANNWNFSPEMYMMHQALRTKLDATNVGGRYKVNQVRLIPRPLTNSSLYFGLVNGVALDDIVRVDVPFRFADRFVLVGKIEIHDTLRANRMTSNYPIDAMDLVQFDKYRIPIVGSRVPIKLSNLILGGPNNRASFVQTRLLNGISFDEFANSIMSLTRPQVIDASLRFTSPVNFDAPVRTQSGLNGIKNFKQFASSLKSARYSFENGLQCNSVLVN